MGNPFAALTDEQIDRLALRFGMPPDFYMETSRETGLDPLGLSSPTE